MNIVTQAKTVKDYVLHLSDFEMEMIETALERFVNGHTDHIAYRMLRSIQRAMIEASK